jgi:hypothetical protein
MSCKKFVSYEILHGLSGAGPDQRFEQLLQPRHHRLYRVLQHSSRPYRSHEGITYINARKGLSYEFWPLTIGRIDLMIKKTKRRC